MQCRSAHAAGGLIATARGDGEIRRIDQPATGTAAAGLGRNPHVGCNFHLRRAGFDEATVATPGSAGVQRAPHFNAVFGHTTHQVNLAPFTRDERLRLRHAGVLDDGASERIERLGRQVHQPPVGPDRAALFNEGIKRALCDGQGQGAPQVQQHLAACTQQHLAILGGQAAFVADFGGNQRHTAALGTIAGGGDVALVDDGIGRAAAEAVVARHEVFFLEL